MHQYKLKNIHPFPARMAPEIAFKHLEHIPKSSTVLDPMLGSGTTLKMANLLGHSGVGFDVDPMALLISRVWNQPVELKTVMDEGNRIIRETANIDVPKLEWIDGCPETLSFIKFWFAEPQESQLRKISYLLHQNQTEVGDVLRVALSRIIITKDKGASLGRDISHSRPHKVRETNDYDVLLGFEKSLSYISKVLKSSPGTGRFSIQSGDAKILDIVEDQSIDYILTSPPYLTAVDYFRGHRLSLVWLGHSLPALRKLRSRSVGLDKLPENAPDKELLKAILSNVGNISSLKPKMQQVISRYAVELNDISKEFFRVLKPAGRATVVLADSYSCGELVSSTQIFRNISKINGFDLVEMEERPILASKRYLPPPTTLASGSSLAKRMKTEAIMTFRKQ